MPRHIPEKPQNSRGPNLGSAAKWVIIPPAWIKLFPSIFDPDAAPPAATIKDAPILKDGEIAITLTGADANTFKNADQKQIRFEIRLSGVEGLPDASARKTLQTIVAMVDRIIGIAERKLF